MPAPALDLTTSLRGDLPINSGSHQSRSDPEVGSGSKSFFVLFSNFGILHKILSILSIDT